MMHLLLSDEARRDPYPLYERMRRESPVARDPHTGRWMLFGYDAVKRALHDHASFSSAVSAPGTVPARWLIFADPPRHAKLRALILRAFTPRAVASLEPRIRDLARALLDARLAAGEMDLVADFAVPLPLMVIAEMLGAPAAEWPRFRRWSDDIVALILTLQGGAGAERAVEAFRAVHAEMGEYLPPLLAERRRAPRDDLLTRLVEAEVEGERLDGDEILAFFQLLLLAGHETTTNLISNAVISLVEHPDQLARLRAAPGLIPSAIEEVLRYRTPVQAVFRMTRADVQMDGNVIPAGELVLAWTASANRDPAHFDHPERFDVTRDPNPHLAFGHGIHFCVGAPLARLEGRIALAALLERMDAIELAGDGRWEPRRAFHVHGPTRLPIRFEARRLGTRRLSAVA
jgi:cytochrome P450